MPFVSDDFIIDLIVESLPSIVVPSGAVDGGKYYKSQVVSYAAGDPQSVTLGFYYDGGTGRTKGNAFGITWTSITPANQPQTEPTVGTFNPPTPAPGRPIASAVGGSIAPRTTQGAIFADGAGELYWWGSVGIILPSDVYTADTRFNGRVEIHYP